MILSIWLPDDIPTVTIDGNSMSSRKHVKIRWLAVGADSTFSTNGEGVYKIYQVVFVVCCAKKGRIP